MVEYREELAVAYSEEMNVSTIFNMTYDLKTGKLVKQEVVGWYHGKPYGPYTEYFSKGPDTLKVEFFVGEGA